MRLIILFLTTAIIQVSASSYGQNVTLKKENASLKTVLNDIRKQTGYDFFYSDKTMRSATSISIDVKNVSLVDALEICFKDQLLTYTIESKSVTIKPKEPSFLDSMVDKVKSVFADTDVRGRVVDEQGNPMPNASIQVKGKSQIYKSNEKGDFAIPDVPDDGVLVVRYVGYKQLEISLKGAVMPLEIKLNVATGELEEVKVVYNTGYQELNKERATGSFVQIDNELFNRGVSTNVLDRILEVTSSLKVENTPSLTNSTNGTNISIRGFSTINANMKPLIVIDGFSYEEQNNFGQISLSNLNPNDVESVTILRDAAAASIWGARSGNGVIVITTKKGKYNQKIDINYNSNFNFIETPRLKKMQTIKPMDAIEFEKGLFAAGMYNQNDDIYPGLNYFPVVSPAVELMLAARKQHLAIPGYNVLTDPKVLEQLAEMGNHDVKDDIKKYLFRTGINQQYAFNISGGSEKMKYYTSVGYDNNIPVEIGNKNDRLTLNFNSTYRPIKSLEINGYFIYTKTKNINNGVGYKSFLPGNISSVAPYTRLAGDQGNPIHVSRQGNQYYRSAYIDTASYPALLDWHYRPLDEINNNDNSSNLYSTRFGGEIKYDFLSGLNVTVSSQYEKSLTNVNNYQNLSSYGTRSLINQFMQKGSTGIIVYPVPRGGILDYINAEQTSWNVRGQLNLIRIWNHHQLNALAGAEISERTYNSNTSRNYGYDSNTGILVTNMDYASRFPVRASGGSSVSIPSYIALSGKLDRFTSYFANVGYTIHNKYTVTGSGRFDASNFFGSNANQRITPLWSSGLAWNITREEFYKLKWLPVLNVRATYGYNANMNNKATALPTASYNSANGVYHNESYLRLLTPPNPGLTWEKIKIVNLGLDFGLFNQRITGLVEYYIKKGKNLIGSKLIESTVGVTSYTGNYANMTSKGIDFALNSVNLNTKLKWRTTFNLSYNSDEITNYEISILQQNATNSYVINAAYPVLNKPLFKIYSYRSAGLDPLNGQPRGYVNGEIVGFNQILQSSSTGGAKPSDLIYHGSIIPQLFGNIMNQFSYKNLSLSFNISFAFNYYLRKASINYSSLFNNWGNAHSDYYLRWKKTGDELITDVPSLRNDGYYNFYQFSNSLVVRGDHIRLNDIRISYSLHKSKHLPFDDASLFLYTNNLNTILWKANDQHINPTNQDSSQPPIQRTVALGLNINF